MATMICTNCYCDTGVPPPNDTETMPVEVLVALATNWLCNDCLDDLADTPSGVTATDTGRNT